MTTKPTWDEVGPELLSVLRRLRAQYGRAHLYATGVRAILSDCDEKIARAEQIGKD